MKKVYLICLKLWSVAKLKYCLQQPTVEKRLSFFNEVAHQVCLRLKIEFLIFGSYKVLAIF
jgi:hypothetical protein